MVQVHPLTPKRDLVEELRNWEGEYHYPAGLLNEAANEIERLRGALADILTADETSTLAGAVAIAAAAMEVK